MSSDAWTTDHGRTGDRIASVAPSELHQAICQAAIDGIRRGIPACLLDGHTIQRAGSLVGAVRNQRQDRLSHLDQEIAEARRRLNRARANANDEDDQDLAEEYRQDARHHAERIRRLEAERRAAAHIEAGVLSSFESGADYVAHALARLATIERDTHGSIADALAHILRVTAVDVSDPGIARFTFFIDVPADGRVARLGPLDAVVKNHAYRKTIARDARGDVPRKLLAGMATARGLARQLRTSPDHVLLEVTDELERLGYTKLAAGTAVRSALMPLYAVLAHDLWAEPLPDELDPGYVSHVLAVYKNPNFEWNRRYHALDCTMRQQLIDTVVEAGGRLDMAETLRRLEHTKIDKVRLSIFTRTQQLGDAPPWLPCLERAGNWNRRAGRANRFLVVATCPHCGGGSTKALRTPECPDGLLCPTCRRTARSDSPVYPRDYLGL